MMTKKLCLLILALGLGTSLVAQRFQKPKYIYVKWALAHNSYEEGSFFIGAEAQGSINNTSFSRLSISVPVQKNFVFTVNTDLGIATNIQQYTQVNLGGGRFTESSTYKGGNKGINYSVELQYFPLGANSRTVSPYLYMSYGKLHFNSSLSLDQFSQNTSGISSINYNHTSTIINTGVGVNIRLWGGTFFHTGLNMSTLANPIVIRNAHGDEINVNQGAGFSLGVVQRIGR